MSRTSFMEGLERIVLGTDEAVVISRRTPHGVERYARVIFVSELAEGEGLPMPREGSKEFFGGMLNPNEAIKRYIDMQNGDSSAESLGV